MRSRGSTGQRASANNPESNYWAAVLATRSAELTSTEKLLPPKMAELDRPKGARQPGGCFANSASLAEELGMSERTIMAVYAKGARPEQEHLRGGRAA
jgi:hypothetical protein